MFLGVWCGHFSEIFFFFLNLQRERVSLVCLFLWKMSDYSSLEQKPCLVAMRTPNGIPPVHQFECTFCQIFFPIEWCISSLNPFLGARKFLEEIKNGRTAEAAKCAPTIFVRVPEIISYGIDAYEPNQRSPLRVTEDNYYCSLPIIVSNPLEILSTNPRKWEKFTFDLL